MIKQKKGKPSLPFSKFLNPFVDGVEFNTRLIDKYMNKNH